MPKKEAKDKVSAGRPRSYKYQGERKNFTIRLSDEERALIEKEHKTVQNFVQNGLENLKKFFKKPKS